MAETVELERVAEGDIWRGIEPELTRLVAYGVW